MLGAQKTQGTATIGLTIRHDPAYSLAAQRQTLLNRHRRLHTFTAVAVPHPEAHRDTAIAADPETEEHLFEIITTVFAMAIGRPGAPGVFGSSAYAPYKAIVVVS